MWLWAKLPVSTRFLLYKNGRIREPTLRGFLWGINEIRPIEHLTKWLMFNRYSINTHFCERFLNFVNSPEFPAGSVGKESACTEGNLVSIPGWGGSPEEGTAAHSSILAWRIPRTEEPDGLHPWGHKESDTTERLSTAHKHSLLFFSELFKQ